MLKEGAKMFCKNFSPKNPTKLLVLTILVEKMAETDFFENFFFNRNGFKMLHTRIFNECLDFKTFFGLNGLNRVQK